MIPVNKLTIEYVRDYIESFGYKLLSEIYVNSKEKILLQCPNGHEYMVNFNVFKSSNSRCNVCKIKSKYSIEFVKDYISSFGYKLLSDNFINTSSYISVECQVGHVYDVTFNNFKSMNKRCRECMRLEMILPFCEVKSLIEGKGFELISTSYLGDKHKLTVKCSNNHEYQATYQNIKNGTGCMACYWDSLRGENSKRWKGDLVLENRRIRNTLEYRIWRDSVYYRDNYICQCCDKHTRTLEAHHIENFSSNESLRFDINNGITLCFECHNQKVKDSFHSIYGTKNNTREQLEKYIAMRKANVNIDINELEVI